jgi:uroporphyrinogen decarboxylase
MIAYADAAIDIGLGPTISEPMSSCTVISPKIFKEFSEPYLRKLVNHIQERGKPITMHICGQTAAIWEDIADMGVAGFSIDNVASITDCKNKIGNKTKILGNVNPATTMYMGTTDEVRLETLRCIREGYDSPKGFMPMSGCSLPIETPFENIDAMLDTVAELGYPVNPQKLDQMILETENKISQNEVC